MALSYIIKFGRDVLDPSGETSISGDATGASLHRIMPRSVFGARPVIGYIATRADCRLPEFRKHLTRESQSRCLPGRRFVFSPAELQGDFAWKGCCSSRDDRYQQFFAPSECRYCLFNGGFQLVLDEPPSEATAAAN